MEGRGGREKKGMKEEIEKIEGMHTQKLESYIDYKM